MKIVENPCVATIALTNPNRPEILGLATAASAIVRLDNESRGPLNVSGVANLRKSHVGISGIMNPAPSQMRLLILDIMWGVGNLLPLIRFFGLGDSLQTLNM